MVKLLTCFNCSKESIKNYESNLIGFKINNIQIDYNNIKDSLINIKLISRKDIDIILNLENNKLFKEYIRFFLLYNFGGLVLDGDFEFVNSITDLLKNEMFLGYNTKNRISTNILWSSSVNNNYVKQILDLIRENKYDNVTDLLSAVFSINLARKYNTLVKIEDKIYIYPFDYFYPLDFENIGKDFTENTKSIFYGRNNLTIRLKFKKALFKRIGVQGYTYVFTMLGVARYKIASKKYAIQQKFSIKSKGDKIALINTMEDLKKYSDRNVEYLVIHNPKWLGVTSATKELFENLIRVEDIKYKFDAKKIAKKIVDLGVKQVIFSGFNVGWKYIALYIKEINNSIKIKVFWHGSNSQVIEELNWKLNMEVINLHKKNIVDLIGVCKKSLLNFYLSQGYRTVFIDNTVRITNKKKILNSTKKESKINDKIKIGLYSAGLGWRKNMFTQLASATLIPNFSIDIVPLSDEAREFLSRSSDGTVFGVENGINREELLKRMAQNDINLYVTFSECAPMLPIESLEVGTICLIGNNNHYFENSELKDYLVVDREDDIIQIEEKIKYALKNKEKILSIYNDWKVEHDSNSLKSVENFLSL